MATTDMNWPAVWGAGQLIAFSGIDGETRWDEPLVLHTDESPGSFLVRLPGEVRIEFKNIPALKFTKVLGDVIEAESAQGPYCAAFTDHHTLAGRMPKGTGLVIGGREIGESLVSVLKTEKAELFARSVKDRWVLVAPGKGEQAESLADRGLRADLPAVVEARSAYVGKVAPPANLPAKWVRLLRKAVSIMKVNTEWPNGSIRRRWTTPDRWPHKLMWLWDSAFHGMGFAQVDPATGQEIVLAMLEQIAEDGMLSHMISPVDRSEITQPPVLAWSAKTIFERTKDTAWLKTCVPYLRRYLEWMRLNRDKNGNGIPEWHISGHPLCRSGESGLDNSSRFDRAVLLDAPDFGSFLCHDYACLSELAAAVGEAELSRTCRGHSERIGRAVHDVLWSQRDGLFMDRTFDGPFIEVKAVSGFLPLLAGIADDAQVNRLREHLLNPRTFGTALPLPSIAVDEGTYTKDMWRGPTWINTNYAICCGLRRYGFGEDAQRLKESSLSAIERWYGEEGCLFEFYDSLDITSPRKLDRKQRLSQGTGMAPISDYHWTAALVAAWLMEEGEEEVVE